MKTNFNWRNLLESVPFFLIAVYAIFMLCTKEPPFLPKIFLVIVFAVYVFFALKIVYDAFEEYFFKKYPYYTVSKLFGKRFISPEEASVFLEDTEYDEDQILNFQNTLPTKEKLKKAKRGGFIIIPGPNREISLREILEEYEEYFSFTDEGWKLTDEVLDQKIYPKWYVIKETFLNGSEDKVLKDQLKMFPFDEEPPTLVEMIWAVLLMNFVRDKWIFCDRFLRTGSYNFGDKKGSIIFFVKQKEMKIRIVGPKNDSCDTYVAMSSKMKL